ncbi:MAG: methyltransferase domain-containing protein [Chloroflexi bacterium]|nr:methyltransferase domain-containing protein [Chloroflexota bacterium]
MTSPRHEVATQDEARRIVLDTYGRLDAAGSSVAEALYPEEALAWLPPQVKELALGVGHPVGYAELRPGETVLDLGCGGGIDTFLAARAVGPEGKAIGLDITPEMVERAEAHASLMGLANVEFLVGPMEEVPLPDASVDVIISNGVISMSMQKHKVFWEAWRVLRPGGRIVFGDMPLNGPLPAEIRKHPDALSS